MGRAANSNGVFACHQATGTLPRTCFGLGLRLLGCRLCAGPVAADAPRGRKMDECAERRDVFSVGAKQAVLAGASSPKVKLASAGKLVLNPVLLILRPLNTALRMLLSPLHKSENQLDVWS